ncbi:YjfA family protein [Shimazuella sp. AN120528]|uniref:DUF2690 domain-containing protein n=1 Tax=Shimazuella soli TaxID=1892854 RepID=UPI001F0F4C0A|nr:DUF2690 domain-containing protein [Shimazuella soli]MCH5584794.1 YjfA family protein [Shimazuella soli]
MLHKLRIGLSVAVIAALGFVLGTAPTYAANYYDGKSPVGTGCNKSGVVKSTKYFNSHNLRGTIQLMYSTKCKTAWAYVKLSKPYPSKYGYVNAVIHRNNDKKSYSCYSSGGNGRIIRYQSTCYSAMVYDYKPNTSYAEGTYSPGEADVYSLGRTSSY